MPADMASTPSRAMHDAMPAFAEFDLLGVGHSFDSSTGRSVPVAWQFQGGDSPDIGAGLTELPLGGKLIGHALEAAHVAGSQVIGGKVYSGARHQAAFWHRARPEDEWTLRDDIAQDLAAGMDGQTSIWDLAGTETWGLALVGFDSASEFDEDDNPVRARWVVRTTDGVDWQPIELSGINPQDWNILLFVDGQHGLITAVDGNEEAPAARIFTSADSGTTWEGHDVALADRQHAHRTTSPRRFVSCLTVPGRACSHRSPHPSDSTPPTSASLRSADSTNAASWQSQLLVQQARS